MLERVLTNLLPNALKYSPAGSPIDLAIQAKPDQVHLVVRDYGIGLEPEDLAWLFRRYGRGRRATRRGIEGFGPGLYLSHGIIEAHGGACGPSRLVRDTARPCTCASRGPSPATRRARATPG